MSDHQKLYLTAAAALVLGFALNVQAAPISKCDAAKKKCLGKYVAAALGCHAKAEQRGAAVEAACLAKAGAKVSGGGKGCFDKAAAPPNDCSTQGDLSARLGEADAAILDLVGRIDPSYPTPTLTRCGAARKKCAGKKMAGLMACSAKENKDGLGDPSCAPKTRDKFGGAKGCDVKALTKGPDCLGTTSTAVLESTVDAWQALIADGIDGTPHVACGDGIHEAGEVCDNTAPFDAETTCPGATACDATCTCVAASTLHVAVDPTSPDSVLDTGWTGMGHRMPLVSGTELTLTVSNCDGPPPLAGTCELHGPIANSGAGELRNQRCSNDSSMRCTDDTPCFAGGGTCEFYVGAPFPLSVGGIGLCNESRFFGPIVGTLNLGSGGISLSATRQVGVFKKFSPDNPCAQCIGDPVMNDDVQGGTCDAGLRSGQMCDANGSVPGRPDFGATSLDCPMDPTGLLKNLVIDASSASSTVTLTLSTSSPLCSDGSGERCLCGSCNNAAATACASNADCPDSSGPFPGICGGRRCVGGTNDGIGCASTTECPGAGICGQPGEPSKASACLDDSTTPIPFQCIDTAPVDGEGECLAGPVTKTCSPPHSQRSCGSDPDCAPGTCMAHQRYCFLTGGLTQHPGTNTLSAEGSPDPFVANVASPTLGSVFCVPPTNRAFGDISPGHPGPARMTAKTTMTLRP